MADKEAWTGFPHRLWAVCEAGWSHIPPESRAGEKGRGRWLVSGWGRAEGGAP